MRFAHVIQPVRVPPTSDLTMAQPITFESMRRAKAHAAHCGIEVELLAARFADEPEVVPKDFRDPGLPIRSVSDHFSFQRPRKLPIFADILRCAQQASQAEYLFYSNVDIALVPHFYETVAHLIAKGHDAMVINRRSLPAGEYKPSDHPWL